MAASLKSFNLCKYCSRNTHLNTYNSQWLTHSKLFKSSSSTAKVKWQGVIGLEVHAQIDSASKLFSGSSSKYGGVVNTQVSFLDAALPGTLPVLNRKCVEAGVKTALALGCSVNRVSKFDRKHYFYADLPAGYQITQQRQPIANGGKICFVVQKKGSKKKAELKTVNLTQLQLEQDSGKSLHDEVDKKSLIDLNRAGSALMEIISEPQITSGEEAKAYVKELRQILQTIGTCDGKMSEGSLRVDANISVHRPGEPLGTRAEVKNLNSIKVVGKAVDYEIERQIAVLEAGGEIVNETRSFDDQTGKTVPMRDKEIKQDYRFMPEPNLPPLHLYTSDHEDPSMASEVVLIDKIQKEIPVLPEEQRNRLMEQHGITLFEADAIVTGGMLSYFEALTVGRDIQKLTKYLVEQFYGNVLEYVSDMSECPVQPSTLGKVYDLMLEDEISLERSKEVIQYLISDPDHDPVYLIDEKNWRQFSDEMELRRLCMLELEKNPTAVAKYKKGKKRILNLFVGGVKEATDGRGNPRIISRILKELLSQ